MWGLKYRVMVSPRKRKDGKWSRQRVMWAAFNVGFEASMYVEELRKRNSDWVIEIRKVRRLR